VNLYGNNHQHMKYPLHLSTLSLTNRESLPIDSRGLIAKSASWETRSRINWEYVYASFCTDFSLSDVSPWTAERHYVGPSIVGGLIERAALLRIALISYRINIYEVPYGKIVRPT